MKHLGTVTLETERCILRPFRADDAEQIYKNWTTDHEVTRYLSWQPHTAIEDAHEIIGIWLKGYEEMNTYNWAIELKEDASVIGGIMVVRQNEAHFSGEMGYCIGRDYWSKGYTSEVLKEVLRFLLEDVGYNRIEAHHHTHNIGSGRVMKKAGMTYEGTLRQVKYREKTGFYDLAIYSKLKEELAFSK